MATRNWIPIALVVWGLVMLAAPAAFGQTITRGPLPATARVAFEAPPEVRTVAEAQTFEYRFYLDKVAATALTTVTCTLIAGAAATAPAVTCTGPLSASNRDALNRIGVHAITLSAFRADVGEGPQSAPFTLTSPAGAPMGLRIIQ